MLGTPIVGDTIYGHKHPSLQIHRHFLHATRLKINLGFKGTERTFEAPLPKDLERILETLRQ
jgi:23S rRNA pseudouridine1911/1915/1917 synthase